MSINITIVVDSDDLLERAKRKVSRNRQNKQEGSEVKKQTTKAKKENKKKLSKEGLTFEDGTNANATDNSASKRKQPANNFVNLTGRQYGTRTGGVQIKLKSFLPNVQGGGYYDLCDPDFTYHSEIAHNNTDPYNMDVTGAQVNSSYRDYPVGNNTTNLYIAPMQAKVTQWELAHSGTVNVPEFAKVGWSGTWVDVPVIEYFIPREYPGGADIITKVGLSSYRGRVTSNLMQTYGGLRYNYSVVALPAGGDNLVLLVFYGAANSVSTVALNVCREDLYFNSYNPEASGVYTGYRYASPSLKQSYEADVNYQISFFGKYPGISQYNLYPLESSVSQQVIAHDCGVKGYFIQNSSSESAKITEISLSNNKFVDYFKMRKRTRSRTLYVGGYGYDITDKAYYLGPTDDTEYDKIEVYSVQEYWLYSDWLVDEYPGLSIEQVRPYIPFAGNVPVGPDIFADINYYWKFADDSDIKYQGLYYPEQQNRVQEKKIEYNPNMGGQISPWGEQELYPVSGTFKYPQPQRSRLYKGPGTSISYELKDLEYLIKNPYVEEGTSSTLVSHETIFIDDGNDPIYCRKMLGKLGFDFL